jgi:hypothetical protein
MRHKEINISNTISEFINKSDVNELSNDTTSNSSTNQKVKKIRNTSPFRFNDNLTRITGFPLKLRDQICTDIYFAFTNNITSDQILLKIIENIKSQKCFYNLSEKSIQNISNMLSNSHYSNLIIKYFYDLIKIVEELVLMNQISSKQSQLIDMRAFARKLYKLNINLYMKRESLEITLRKIFDHIKSQFKSFRINRFMEQKLFNDPINKLKECGECHKILGYESFDKYNIPNRKGLRSVCKQCRNKSVEEKYKRKLDVVKSLYELNCPTCDLNFLTYLPAISFHHLKERKTYSWGDNKSYDADFIKKRFEEDGVQAICENCHRLETATIFSDYKHLILNPKLFNFTAKEINKMIENELNNLDSKTKAFKRKYIKRFIRKRYINEIIYQGRCIGCNGEYVKFNLPALDFHHRLKEDEPSRWRDIADKKCEDILQLLIREEIVQICTNCHRMIHTKYHKRIAAIFEEYATESEILELQKGVSSMRERIIQNVYNFKFNLSHISNPLEEKSFSRQDAIKLRILQINYLMQKIGIDSFRRNDFEVFTHINIRNIDTWIPRFLEIGLLEVDKPITSQYQYYKLTTKALNYVRNLEDKYPQKARKIRDKIYSYDVGLVVRPLRHRVFLKYFSNSNLKF